MAHARVDRDALHHGRLSVVPILRLYGSLEFELLRRRFMLTTQLSRGYFYRAFINYFLTAERSRVMLVSMHWASVDAAVDQERRLQLYQRELLLDSFSQALLRMLGILRPAVRPGATRVDHTGGFIIAMPLLP